MESSIERGTGDQDAHCFHGGEEVDDARLLSNAVQIGHWPSPAAGVRAFVRASKSLQPLPTCNLENVNDTNFARCNLDTASPAAPSASHLAHDIDAILPASTPALTHTRE